MIDRYVVRFFLLILAVAGTGLYYQYKKFMKCDNIQFMVLNDKLVAGEVVGFTCNYDEAKKYEWEFEEEPDPLSQSKINHIFAHPGEYTVSLTIDGQCYVSKELSIQPFEEEILEEVVPSFRAPLYAQVGQEISFVDQTEGASSWEWRFGESLGQVDSREQHPFYTFKSAGEKRVTLVVDGQYEYVAAHIVSVMPKEKKKADIANLFSEPITLELEEAPPPPDEPAFISEMPTAPPMRSLKRTYKVAEVTDVELIEMFKLISEEEVEQDVLWAYTCGIKDIPVRVNEDTRMRLYEFCNQIKGKKIRITSIELVRNGDTNCLNFLNITMKKGFFSKILGKE